LASPVEAAFERLAESSYLAVAEFNPALAEFAGWQGWIEFVLFNFAEARPTALLRSSTRFWNCERQPGSEEIERVECDWAAADEGRFIYPIHPFCDFLVHDLFTSSIEAIDQLLDPDAILIVGDVTDELLEAQEENSPVVFEKWVELDAALPETSTPSPLPSTNEINTQTSDEPLPPSVERTCLFQQTKNGWLIQFCVGDVNEGPEAFDNKDGFAEWKRLLEAPYTSFGSLELSPADGYRFDTSDTSTDPKTLAEARKAWKSLKEKHRLAEAEGDHDGAERMRETLDKYEAYINGTTDIHGNIRSMGPECSGEVARKRVGARLRRTISRIEKSMPKLGAYLQKTLVAVGTSFQYSPSRHPLGQHVEWHF
jgi:hypothetical protein